ncbi:uncharacterized protein IUM83_04149 [Phytophthora cinnamomi]|uniref:uncharacterized protein n=1 Tax=Phytophthora cinnamomi TaxID=4785 RepID=UPI003559494A|nr:hypothetical protein IUM83_04149 [Phytophthora cinnamomi]
MEDGAAADADVWSSFEKSVAYMKEVAALYESAFGCRADGVRKTVVSKAHLDEAHNQAQQALELLASNLLNASMTVMNAVERQESEADRLKCKVSAIRQNIRDRQTVLDQAAVDKFYESHKPSRVRSPRPVSSADHAGRHESGHSQQQLRLSLAPEQCMQ